MTYRQIYIKSAEHLYYRESKLIVKNKEEKEIETPLEDIAVIILEDSTTTLTSRLLSAMAEYYIVLITCDKKFLPTSITMPLNHHYKQLEVFNLQITAKKTLNSQLWSKIITAKINYYIAIMEFFECDEERIKKMKSEVKEIKYGDKTNREAICARIFFSSLYGPNFIRNHTSCDGINAALNYGYSIMAAHISRLLTMYGFNTMIGIHHDSKTNSFNLSYDIVEPFRACVDKYVYEHLDELTSPLSRDIRKGLINLMESRIVCDGMYYSIRNAMEEVVKSYLQCLKNDDSKYLILPSMFDYGSNTDIEL